MKKSLALILALCTLFAISACGEAPAEPSVQAEKPAPASAPAQSEPTPEPTPQEKSSAGIDPELKAFLDSYEAFIDEYVEFMNSYKANPLDTNLLTKYADILTKYEDFAEKIDAVNENELNNEELAYYIDVTARASKKVLEIIG